MNKNFSVFQPSASHSHHDPLTVPSKQASSSFQDFNTADPLSHIAHLDKIAHTGTLSEHQKYCKFALVSINGFSGTALIDSGNTWRTVISPSYASTLGIDCTKDLKPLSMKTIGTAQKGGQMKILGETKNNYHITFSPSATKFKFKPVIVEGLSMPINISGPFLRRHNIDQLHSRDSLLIQSQLIPLYSELPQVSSMETANSKLFTLEDLTLEPWSINHVLVSAPNIQKGLMPSGDGVVHGSLDFMSKFDAHPWVNAISSASPQGGIKVGIMNTHQYPISIPAKTFYGTFQLTCDPSESVRYPWRVAAMPNIPRKSDEDILGDVDLKEASTKLPSFMTGPTTHSNYLKRLNFLISEFNLAKSSVLSTSAQQLQAAELLLKYWNTFSFDGSFGSTSLLEHTIYTEPGPPINMRYRPINPALEPQLKTQLYDWLKHDVIEESSSAYNFGLVCVPKKNGKSRWCVDYRPLNKISKRDTYPIGSIDDNLVRLSRSKIFSGLDGSGAFHVIPLAKESREKTAFATPFGSYHFKRLPFGLANGPSTYARLVKMVLHGIPTSVALPYLDDTICHSPDLPSHFLALERVLSAHAKAGLKLQPSKCQLFRNEIDYLGHTVSADGVRPLDSYIKIVQDWPLPTTRRATRSFLGKTGYYRRFIANYAGVARPLTDKLSLDGTHDNAEFDPSPDFVRNFHTLKNALVSAPILAYPRFDSDEPFILDTDWSYDNGAVGGCLSQVQDGDERVIAYGGHKLAVSQRNYGPTKGELFAVIFFLNHWRYYLSHRHFLLRTDHMALKHMMTMEAPKGMIQRWLHLLAQFHFTVEHRPGPKHGNADALSRAPHLPDNSDEAVLVDEVEDFVAECTPVTDTTVSVHVEITTDSPKPENAGTVHSIAPGPALSFPKGNTADLISVRTPLYSLDPLLFVALIFSAGEGSDHADDHADDRTPASHEGEREARTFSRANRHRNAQVHRYSFSDFTPDLILRHQQHDPDMSFLFQHHGKEISKEINKTLSPTGRKYAGLSLSIFVDSQTLLRLRIPATANTIQRKREVVLLPSLLIPSLVKTVHRQIVHQGVLKTVEKLRLHVYFENMTKHVTNIIGTCQPCQTKTTRLPDQHHTLYSSVPGYPFQKLSLDFVGPFPSSGPQQYRYLLTIKDVFTKWIEAFPIRHPTSKEVIKILTKEIFPRFGKCTVLHSDQGTQFTSKEFQEMGKLLKITLTTTPAYNPKSNPVERLHRDLKAALMALTADKPNEWAKHIPTILYAFRTSINKSTGYSPFQLMFGRDPIEDLDLIIPSPPFQFQIDTASEYFQELLKRTTQAFHIAREHMGLAIQRQRSLYHRTPKTFSINDQVWLFTPILPGRALPKFRSGWSGPWKVTGKVNELTYHIVLASNHENKQVVAIDRMRLYLPEEDDEIPPVPGSLTMAGDEFAETLFSSTSTTAGRVDLTRGGGGRPTTPPPVTPSNTITTSSPTHSSNTSGSSSPPPDGSSDQYTVPAPPSSPSTPADIDYQEHQPNVDDHGHLWDNVDLDESFGLLPPELLDPNRDESFTPTLPEILYDVIGTWNPNAMALPETPPPQRPFSQYDDVYNRLTDDGGAGESRRNRYQQRQT